MKDTNKRAHKNLRLLTLIVVSVNQKIMGVCENTVKMCPLDHQALITQKGSAANSSK